MAGEDEPSKAKTEYTIPRDDIPAALMQGPPGVRFVMLIGTYSEHIKVVHCLPSSSGGFKIVVNEAHFNSVEEYLRCRPSTSANEPLVCPFWYWNSEDEYWQYIASKSNGRLVLSSIQIKAGAKRKLLEATRVLDEMPGFSVINAAKFLGVNRRTITRMVASQTLEKLPGNRGISIQSHA
jgi:hypothetical protein